MRTLCVLAVLVVAVAASPDCSSYCDQIYYGWKVDKRPDCNCYASQTKELRDGLKYEHDLKSILLPELLPSEIKHNKIKRSLHDGPIPVDRDHSSITSKSSDDDLHKSQLNETNLSDCIDLLISISIRKNKNKSIDNLEPNSLQKKFNLNNLEINTEIKNKCGQASAIMQKSIEKIKEHQKNMSTLSTINMTKNQNVDVVPKLEMRSAFELSNEKSPATSTNKLINSTVKSISYDKPFTNAITTNNTTILNPAINDFNLFKTLREENNQEESNKRYKFKNFNYSAEDDMKDDDNTTNLNVNTISTKLTNTQTITDDLSYNLKNLRKNKLNDELTFRKSQGSQTFEKVQNKSNLMADYSDNIKESTSKPNQYTTNSNKTVVLKTINQNENNAFLRDKYKENEVPIVSIITREYPNNTISSFLNGNETFNYSKFEEEAIINNNNTKNTSDSRLFDDFSSELEIRSESDETPFSSEEQSSEIMSPTIKGRLFFEYDQEFIPGHFVQTSDGDLKLSLDMNTICDELVQKGKQNSLLISNLCQYLNKKYQSIGYGM